jgi:hypothetical protein
MSAHATFSTISIGGIEMPASDLSYEFKREAPADLPPLPAATSFETTYTVPITSDAIDALDALFDDVPLNRVPLRCEFGRLYIATRFAEMLHQADGQIGIGSRGPCAVGCLRCGQGRLYAGAVRASRALARWERHVCPRRSAR